MTKSTILLDEEEFDLVESVKPLSEFFTYEDTGLMTTDSSGIILHRKGFGSEQIVYQIEPRYRAVCFKEEEDSEESDLYNLPFPYVILLIAYEKGIFRGIRHFYSPTPIYTLDQPLYMPSLPNTNCMGYRGTSLGWVCIYHGQQPALESLTARLEYALERYDPVAVPYNYANMSETDGHTFYDKYEMPKRTYRPYEWERAGKQEDLSWVVDPESWIEAKVDPADIYISQYVEDGEPLTLRRTLYGQHYVYYSEEGAVHLNQYHHADEDVRKDLVKQLMRNALLNDSGTTVTKTHPKTAAGYISLFAELEHHKDYLQMLVGSSYQATQFPLEHHTNFHLEVNGSGSLEQEESEYEDDESYEDSEEY